MLIRRMGRGDLAEVMDIWNPVIRDTTVTFTSTPKTEADLVQWLEAEGPRLVAAEGAGAVLGFVGAGPFRSGPGYAFTWEHSVHVAAAARGRGVGRALMDALVAELRARRAHGLIGAVSGDNPRSVSFHLRLGFREVGRIPEAGFKFGRWLDLAFLHKGL